MGDISEMRGLVTIASFVGCLVILMGFIPPQFLIPDYEGRNVQPPEYFEAMDIQSFNLSKLTTFNESGDDLYGVFGYAIQKVRKHIDLGGHDFDIYFSRANKSHHDIEFIHTWYDWVIFIHEKTMNFYDKNGQDLGTKITGDYLDTKHDNGEPLEFTVKSLSIHRFQVTAVFAFNETLYSSPTEAWNHYDFHVYVGMGFDQISTGYNAWDLIAMLLFFQLPNVHWIINALLAIPLWIAVAYLTYILILRAIGAIFGGGA